MKTDGKAAVSSNGFWKKIVDIQNTELCKLGIYTELLLQGEELLGSGEGHSTSRWGRISTLDEGPGPEPWRSRFEPSSTRPPSAKFFRSRSALG